MAIELFLLAHRTLESIGFPRSGNNLLVKLAVAKLDKQRRGCWPRKFRFIRDVKVCLPSRADVANY